MAKAFIYSTLTANNIFRVFGESVNGLPNVKKTILIKGGAGVANSHIITPRGVVTEVEDEDLKLLEEHAQFKRMVERGFLLVERKQADVEVVVKNMKKKDKSAPKVPEDYKDSESKPTTN